MKVSWLLLLIIVLPFVSSCYRPAARQAFEDLKILEGNWSSTADVKFEEYWNTVNDTTIVGLGYSLNNGDTAFKEQLKIIRKGNEVYYCAKTGEERDFVYFRLEKAGKNKWIFKNSDHDYPNIIAYYLKDEHTLVAKISNLRGNKEVLFKMQRVTE